MLADSSIMGTYVLALHLDRPHEIEVGRLGSLAFPAGRYLYVGSARGSGGLHSRLARHQRLASSGKQLHWHVDYLREHATWGGAWGRPGNERFECEWAAELRKVHARLGSADRLQTRVTRIFERGFGASDCQCGGHLIHVLSLPDNRWFAENLGAKRIWVENRAINSLLRELTTGQEEVREAAAVELGRYGEAAVRALTELLGHADAEVRWWAVRALAEAGGSRAVLLLIGTLEDPDADVRACAALALGRLGDGTAAPALAASLADPSPFVASIAADALSMIGEGAISALVGTLKHGSTHTRLLAVRALSRIKSDRIVGPLLGVLEDPSYLVSFYARETLEELGIGMVLVKP